MSVFGDDSEFDFDASSILGMSNVLNRDETDSGINLKAMEKKLFKEAEYSYSGEDDGVGSDKEDDDYLSYDPLKEYNNLISGEMSYTDDDTESDEPKNTSIDNSYITRGGVETEEQITQNTINNYFNDDMSYSSSSNDITKNKNYTNNEKYKEDNGDWDKDYSNILEEENRDDMKLRLLERIDNLKEELEDDGINLNKIPSVDFSSKLEDIENVAKLLMLKATRNRYSNMGEEFILAISNGLEILCNGEREFFGIKPDLTNCTDIVKVKLRRVKNETSQIVADVVEKYEIPPLFTVLIELVPALFLHSQRRSRQKTLCVDLSDDINEIRKYN